MKICITRSSRFVYSETFIRDQINVLSQLTQTYTLHSGRLPEKDENGKFLNSKLFFYLHKILKPLLGRNNYFGEYGVKKYLLNNEIDIVLANYGMPGAHMTPICKQLNIPLLVIFHGHDATDIKLLNKYKHKYLKMFDYASKIIAVSIEMKNKLIQLGANQDKIVVIPYGVETSKFYPLENSERENFLAVGRFTEKKGPLITINAFSQVVQKFKDVKLIMVGGKTGMFKQCQELVTNLNLQNSVVFKGVLNSDEIAALMQTSFAFVQHSITASNGDMEGTPLGILEASASGLPIVSTYHGGIKEAVIHNKTGYLVEEHDQNAMSNFMIKIVEDKEKSIKMGLEGRTHILLNHDQKTQISKIYELAKTIVNH